MQIVFVHGSGGCAAVWHHQTRFFPGSDAVDLPGHPRGDLLPSVDAYTEWLKGHVDRRAYRDVVIVGHSIGGAIAMLYALKYPADLRGIVLVGSGARLRVLPQTLELLEKAVDDRTLFTAMIGSAWEKVEPELVNALVERSEEIGPAAFANDLRACDRFDVMDRISQIETPTLALCGSEDVMTPPKYSHFLADRIPSARAVIIEGGTHMVFLEKPEAVNEAIEAFVASL